MQHGQFLRPFELIFTTPEPLTRTARHIFTPGENTDLVPNVRISKLYFDINIPERHVNLAQLFLNFSNHLNALILEAQNRHFALSFRKLGGLQHNGYAVLLAII